MNRVRWGLIGCGDVTEIKNGPGLYKCRDSELVGVSNRTIARAEDWVTRHGHGRVFKSLEELLASPDIDIVYVAVTPDAHRNIAIASARAGKHCLLEKPIAPRYEDAEEIRQAFQEAGKKIFVAHYRRALPRTEKLRDLIAAIAPLQYVRVTRTSTGGASGWRARPEIAGGGVFFETDVHLVDLLDHLFGPLCDRKILAGEDHAALLARADGGILVNGLWHYHSAENSDLCEVSGAKGILSFPAMGEGNAFLREPGAAESREIVLPREQHIGQPLEQTIVDELLGRGTCPSTLKTAMRALRICCEAEEAGEWGQGLGTRERGGSLPHMRLLIKV